MNEHEARAATLLEAYETHPGDAWTDDDRRWADRVALETAGERASHDVFVAERARQAMHRLLPRDRGAARWLERRSRVGAWTVLAAIAGVVLGVWPDPFGGAQRVNLLAPPLWGVLAWNVVAYVVIVAMAVATLLGLRPAPGVIRRTVRRWLGDAPADGGIAVSTASGAIPTAASPLAQARLLWQRRSAAQPAWRAATLLHVGAAAIGVGLVAGLYLRGLVLDYRVVWESTFLEPATVHAWLTTALAPASALTGIALPDAATVAAWRDDAGGARNAGAPAAPVLHLLAATVGLVVVAPRALLALVGALRLAALRRRFPLALDAPYHQRLARLQRGAGAEVVAVPYAQTPSPQAVLGLQALLGEALGPKAALRVAPTAAFGAGDDALAAPAGIGRASHVVVLCDLAATPEDESHGRFAARLAALVAPATPLALVVDEGAFRRRFAGLDDRVAQRRAAWRAFAAGRGASAAFVDLEVDDAGGRDAASAALQAAFANGLKPPAGALAIRP